MGCCMSTATTKPANTGDSASASASASKKNRVGSNEEASSKPKSTFSHESRAPPPSFEEETVKEVLSETPKPKSLPMPKPEPTFCSTELMQDSQQQQEAAAGEEESKIFAHKVEAFAKMHEKKRNWSSNEEEIMSQASEICSVSISISESLVSTMTNVTDKRDYDEAEQEVRQPLRQRSPAKPPPRNGFRRDRVVSQSPTRKSDQSPGKRFLNGSARLVQGQDSGRLKGPGRRDPGESSGRRSRSPATTRSNAVMGRSQSAGRTNQSQGRVRSGPTENRTTNGSRTVDGGSSKWGSTNNDRRNCNDNCSVNESLENPLVSLECFIFL